MDEQILNHADTINRINSLLSPFSGSRMLMEQEQLMLQSLSIIILNYEFRHIILRQKKYKSYV